MSKVWKVLELTVAKYWGVARNALSGSNSHITMSDTLHPYLYIECKYSKSLPKYITDLWADTARKAKEEGKIPVVVMKGRQQSGFFVLTDNVNIDRIIQEREVIF